MKIMTKILPHKGGHKNSPKKCPRKVTQKCPRNVTQKEDFSWTKVSTKCHQKCPRDVTYYVHEMSATRLNGQLIDHMVVSSSKDASRTDFNNAGAVVVGGGT